MQYFSYLHMNGCYMIGFFQLCHYNIFLQNVGMGCHISFSFFLFQRCMVYRKMTIDSNLPKFRGLWKEKIALVVT